MGKDGYGGVATGHQDKGICGWWIGGDVEVLEAGKR